MKLITLALILLAFAACTPHLVIDPNAGPPVPRMRPHLAPTVVDAPLLPTVTPTSEVKP